MFSSQCRLIFSLLFVQCAVQIETFIGLCTMQNDAFIGMCTFHSTGETIIGVFIVHSAE